MGLRGFEPPTKNTRETAILDRGGAECGALGAREAPIDPELAVVFDAWPVVAGKAWFILKCTSGE